MSVSSPDSRQWPTASIGAGHEAGRISRDDAFRDIPPAGSPGEAPQLDCRDLALGYGEHLVCPGLDLGITRGGFTVIVGPNACGKSTLLKALARVLGPQHGQVLFDGKDIADISPRMVASRMGLLPQSALAPDGMCVRDLVARGRFPHRSMLRRWNASDEAAVVAAMAATRTTDLAERLVDELSGGQRQRVWVAMLLAQQVPLMLLDEPTTFLDIAHQYELLDLLSVLHQRGATLVAVLHDLNQAARYASELVVMHQGQVVTTGSPQEVLTPRLMREVFGLECLVVPDPATGTPMVVPVDARRA